MLLLHFRVHSLNLLYNFPGNPKTLAFKHRPRRIIHELSLRINAKPEVGFNAASHIQFFSRYLARFQGCSLHEVVGEEVNFNDEHANDEFNHEHAFVLDCVLSLLLFAAFGHTILIFGL